MSDELVDFSNLLSLKNHLAFGSITELLDLYKDMDDYILFIDMFVYLTENDSGFLLLNPEFLDKVLMIVQIHRFDIEDSEIKDIVNSIIGYINRIKATSEDIKNIFRNNYLAYHEDLRECQFHENDAFIASIAFDANVFKALYGEFDDIDSGNHKLIVISLNYLIKVCPEIFDDESVRKNAYTLLDICMKGNKMFDQCRRTAKEIKVKIKEMGKKSE